MLRLKDNSNILILGIGHAGNGVINQICSKEDDTKNVTYAFVDTDTDAVNESLASAKFQIGKNIDFDSGKSTDPGKGIAAVSESSHELESLIKKHDIVILISGMGGGVGTGATMMLAEMCELMAVPVITVTTMPFSFESSERRRKAEKAIEIVKQHTDMYIILSNDSLLLTNKDNWNVHFEKSIHTVVSLIMNTETYELSLNDIDTMLEKEGLTEYEIGVKEKSRHHYNETKEKTEKRSVRIPRFLWRKD